MEQVRVASICLCGKAVKEGEQTGYKQPASNGRAQKPIR
jgi:hypothetical protein